MPGQNGRIHRQNHQFLRKGTDQFRTIAPLQIGSADAAHEEGISAEKELFLRRIETYTSRGMSRRMDHMELRIAYLYDVTVTQIRLERHALQLLVDAELPPVRGKDIQKKLVRRMRLGLDAESIEQNLTSEDMVQVQVCLNDTSQFQPI